LNLYQNATVDFTNIFKTLKEASTMPTAVAKVQRQGMSKELSEPLPEPESFEGLKGVREIAGDLGNQ